MANREHDADLRREERARKAAGMRKTLAQERTQDICDSALDTTGESARRPGGRRKTTGTGQRALDINAAGGSGACGAHDGGGGHGSDGHEAGSKGGCGGGRAGGGAT